MHCWSRLEEKWPLLLLSSFKRFCCNSLRNGKKIYKKESLGKSFTIILLSNQVCYVLLLPALSRNKNGRKREPFSFFLFSILHTFADFFIYFPDLFTFFVAAQNETSQKYNSIIFEICKKSHFSLFSIFNNWNIFTFLNFKLVRL